MIGLLLRWHGGDRQAIDELLVLVLPWLHGQMSKAMADLPNATQDSMDLAQAAIVKFLSCGPRFLPENVAQFRGLLLRIARNELIDHQRRGSRRGPGRHLESIADSRHPLSEFAASSHAMPRPGTEVVRSDEAEWVRLALQFLKPDERYLLIASEVEQLDWATIASELGLPSEDAARMQCVRLKPRVARLLIQLRNGRVPNESA
jgi:RNA polymerase sigma factor (sigma-70 family)